MADFAIDCFRNIINKKIRWFTSDFFQQNNIQDRLDWI
jgi:hypothetical protein